MKRKYSSKARAHKAYKPRKPVDGGGEPKDTPLTNFVASLRIREKEIAGMANRPGISSNDEHDLRLRAGTLYSAVRLGEEFIKDEQRLAGG